MSDINHKAEALLGLKMASRDVSANYERQTGEKKSDLLALTQIHATLYLAEQQRVANLIALASFSHEVDGGRVLCTGLSQAMKWRDEAIEAMGLS